MRKKDKQQLQFWEVQFYPLKMNKEYRKYLEKKKKTKQNKTKQKIMDNLFFFFLDTS